MERRGMRAWLIALGIVVLAFAGTVVTLNFTVYSASGFVSSYLDALARHDVAGALATPGVTLPSSGSRALLRPDAMGDLSDIRLVSDTAASDGRHRVVYAYRSGARTGKSAFTVERDGTNLGLFSAWRFETSPVATLAVTPLHAATFIANGLTLSPKAGQDVATRYTVLAPAAVVLSHKSEWLSATAETALVSSPGSRVDYTVNVQASAKFVKTAQKELDAYLAQCVKQKVLQPTGCPMGQEISDRIQDAPTWSIVSYPVITIVPDKAPGSWLIPGIDGTAHVKVTVKSIFDGSVSDFDKNVPFFATFVITFQPDGSLLLTGT